MIEGRDIICLASSHWDSGGWVNCQHIMSRLSASNRILYVEPLSLRPPGKGRGDMRKILYRISAFFKGPRRISENLLVYSPVIIPAHGNRIVRCLNRLLVKAALRRIMRKHRLSSPLLWAFLPTGVEMVGQLDERLVIYHCVDNYSANPGVDRPAVEMLEKRMLEKADLVFTTSPALMEKCARFNPYCSYHPNVADAAHFSAALEPATVVPEDIRRLPGPRVGFIGNITGYKVDLELVAFAAEKLPDISFVLIGPIGAGDPGTDVSALIEMPNVTLLGEKEYGTLPAYLKGIDACMIPFRSNETTRGVFPMKFFEFMAAGKPVVVTGLPALAEFADNCYTATGPDDFVEMISRAVGGEDQDKIRKRVELAAAHSWPERIEVLSDLIEKQLSISGGHGAAQGR